MILKDELNTFFVSCFYSILGAEERSLESLTNGKLSLKEIHIIEQVFNTMAEGENNFSTIAKRLRITLGTLTTNYARLEKKGYLTKRRDEKDKRVYYIIPTFLAEQINIEHSKFHKRLIDGIAKALDEKEQSQLITALKHLTNFFDTLE